MPNIGQSLIEANSGFRGATQELKKDKYQNINAEDNGPIITSQLKFLWVIESSFDCQKSLNTAETRVQLHCSRVLIKRLSRAAKSVSGVQKMQLSKINCKIKSIFIRLARTKGSTFRRRQKYDTNVCMKILCGEYICSSDEESGG